MHCKTLATGMYNDNALHYECDYHRYKEPIILHPGQALKRGFSPIRRLLVCTPIVSIVRLFAARQGRSGL